MVGLTVEEDNFIRVFKFLTGIGTKAVRKTFNNYFPPHLLVSILLREETKVKGLKALTQKQKDLLYPVSSSTTSNDFDITLMICLLRNFANIIRPTNGFDELPPSNEISTGADLARLKYYRNFIAHTRSIEMDSQQFNIMWTDLTEAVVRLSGDPKLKDLCEDLKYLCSCHGYHQAEIEDWEQNNKSFVTTEAIEYILKKLNTVNVFTVTGNPGIGKSATLHHIALHLRDADKYHIIPCRNPSDIEHHPSAGEKQLFVIDDLCGRYTLIQNDINEWEKYQHLIIKVLSQGHVKLISSNRSIVFNDPQFQRLEVFNKNYCNLSTGDHAISTEEKTSIAKKYLSVEILSLIKDNIDTFQFFPLMCSLFKTRIINDALEYFSNPFDLYKDEIVKLQEQDDKSKYCLLLLSVLCNGTICETLFDEEEYFTHGPTLLCDSLEICASQSDQVNGLDNREKKSRFFENLFDVCEMERNTSRTRLFRQLVSMVNIFFLKKENLFVPIHNNLFDFLCFHFGTTYPRLVINYANSKIIRDRIHFTSIAETDNMFSIAIEEKDEALFFSRIIKDIFNGKIYDVFYNNQMKYSTYRSKLIQFLQKQQEIDLSQLFSTKDKALEVGTNKVSALYLVCYIGLIDFVIFILCHSLVAFDAEYYPLIAAAASGHDDIVKMLISKGADVNFRDESGNTPLVAACIGKHKTTAIILLEHGADVNRRTRDGPTPLQWACSSNYKEITELLLYKGADINKCDYKGRTPVTLSRKCDSIFNLLIYKGADLNIADKDEWTPLMWACYYGLVEAVEIMICNGAHINATNCRKQTPLMIACLSENIDIASILLKGGAYLNNVDQYGRTALMTAVEGDHFSVLDFLLKKGANVNKCDYSGVTPLIEACWRGKYIFVDMLLKHNADCNKTDAEGLSPLMSACLGGHYTIIEVLIKNGAAIDKRNSKGSTALQKFCEGISNRAIFERDLINYPHKIYANNFSYTHLLERPSGDKAIENIINIVKLLISSGADPNTVDNEGWSSLMWAATAGHFELSSLLIKLGATADVINKIGESIVRKAIQIRNFEIVNLLFDHGADMTNELILSSREGNVEMVNFLIDRGVDIEKENDDGQVALNEACLGQINIVDLLIQKGVNVNRINATGKTPLIYACQSRDVEIVKMLLREHALVNVYDIYKMSPLLVSAKHGFNDLFEILMKHGADINLADVNGWTPLIYSISNRNEALMKMCFDYGCDIDTERNPLKQAFECGNIDVIETLLNHGANLHFTDSDGRPPLHIAISANQHFMVNLLIKNGANCNEVNSNSIAPLLFHLLSCEIPNIQIVNDLLEGGSDIDMPAKNGNTALIYACQHVKSKHMHDLIKIFIHKGAVVNIKDESGWTPLMWLCKHGEISLTQLMIGKGADVNASHKSNITDVISVLTTPMTLAFEESNYEIMHLLFKNGAVIDSDCATAFDRLKKTVDILKIFFNNNEDNQISALISAIKYGDNKLVQYLHNIICAGNVSDYQNITRLLYACYAKDLETIKLLHTKEANANFKNIKKLLSNVASGIYIHVLEDIVESALMHALQNGNIEVARLLIVGGVDSSKAFLWACQQDDWTLVEFLSEFNFEINVVDANGWNPLTWLLFHRKNLHIKSDLNRNKYDDLIDNLIYKGADYTIALSENLCRDDSVTTEDINEHVGRCKRCTIL